MHTAKVMQKIKERVRNETASPGPQSSISLGVPGSFTVQGKAVVSSQPSKNTNWSAVRIGNSSVALLRLGATWTLERVQLCLQLCRKKLAFAVHEEVTHFSSTCPPYLPRASSSNFMNSSTSWWYFYECAVLTFSLKAKLTRSTLRGLFCFVFKSHHYPVGDYQLVQRSL